MKLKYPEFETYFKHQIKLRFTNNRFKNNLLKKSILYTLLAPASRFRSLLAIATTKYLNQNTKKIFPWALAIEMVHSGSLIHDDLPLMDNGKMRRNKKCNHLVFGADISLLAGSCLFIESFLLLNQPIFNKKQNQMIQLFVSKIGFKGLIMGQSLDLTLKRMSSSDYLKMVQLKTGSLFEAAVEGPLLLWNKNKQIECALKNFSKYLGIAYQLVDDLKDKDVISSHKKIHLKEITQKSLDALKPLKKEPVFLKHLAKINQKRIL